MIRLLVVGLGRQGQRHLRIARQLDGVKVVATVDVVVPAMAEGGAKGSPVASPGRPAGPANGGTPPHFSRISDALEAVKVDAAVVATPSGFHAEHTAELIGAGIPVLTEKPLATTDADARALDRQASGKGVLLAVGHVERFNPAVQLVRSMRDAGELGTPISVSFCRVGLPPRSGQGEGVVHDLAVHDIDVFSYLVGEPVLAGATGWPRTTAPEAAFVTLASGDVSGLVEVNWRTPVRIRQFTVTTDTCVVAADYTTQRVEVTEATEGDDPLEFVAFQAQYSTARRRLFEPSAREPLAEELRAFCEAVAGAPSSVLATGSDGRLAVSIAEQASTRVAGRKG